MPCPGLSHQDVVPIFLRRYIGSLWQGCSLDISNNTAAQLCPAGATRLQVPIAVLHAQPLQYLSCEAGLVFLRFGAQFPAVLWL